MIASILFVCLFWMTFEFPLSHLMANINGQLRPPQQQLSVHMLAISLALTKCVFNHMVEPQKKKE